MKQSLSLLAKAIAASALAITAVGANAQDKPGGMYGEIGLTQITYKESGYSIEPTVMRAIVGADIAPNAAIEGMFGFGVADGSVRIDGVNVKGEINNTWGVFVRPKVNLAPNFEVFGRLGFAKTKLAVSAPGIRLTDSGSDFAYGIGAAYKVTDKVALNVDYMSYYDKDGIKANGFTFGLGFKF